MSNAFRFVIVGSGNMADTYAKILAELSGLGLAATVSRSGRRPQSVPEHVELVDSLANVQSDYDAVILATPNGMHAAGAIEAAALGKHVLTEKVLDVTREAMDTMIRACRDADVKLGVAFQRRMSPDNQALRALLDNSVLGRVFGADLVVKFYRDQAYYDSSPYRGDRTLDGGGPFIQQAAHNVDVYVWLFGLPQTVVSALGTFCHEIEGEDHGAALLRYDNGMVGTIIASTSCKPGFPARLEVHAEKGTVVLENDEITVWEVEGVTNPSSAGQTKIHSGASSAAVSDTAGHEAIVLDFVEAVREDRDPIVAGEDARRATELILDIYANGI
ncbi:MAG: Gfo/Idh/MocA family oxidoreductase [Lentisphaeria bacterium]|nr:Gfo/Idh/MocA family oxidoreductase [Lentisphaeria bacterium]